ncbi:MAG: MBL fold metallo-hydrolase [Deltaproteobacteria bacterium]|nr:MBL fold metallo-hydrolase [Deltaproteobacteria bacterium]
MTKICVLASGSKGNAIFVSNDKTAILIDAGLSGTEIDRRLRSRNISPDALDAVVVSHEHGDHIHGVGVMSRRFHLPVYINEPTLAVSRTRLGALHEVRHFQRGASFCIGSLSIHPFSVSHDAADPVGFTIRDGGAKIGIATDLGVATKLVCHHLEGCSLMILEANHDLKMLEEGPYPWHVKQRISSRLGHLSNEASRDLLGAVAGSKLKHVIVSHMSETNNEPGKALSVVGEAVSHQAARLSLAPQHEAGDMIILDHTWG